MRLRAATRGSPLARWQAEHVASLLRAHDPAIEIELVIVETSGDQRRDVPIYDLGGKGVFVKDVQAAVLDGRAEIAVHSAKDLPSTSTDGLTIAAVPPRGDPRDALVGAALDRIPDGGVVATGSLRRRAQLANLRPDLRFEGLRGNMHTRLEKAAGYDAIVVAVAALERLELAERIAERLAPDRVVPQVGQGALAVECATDDAATRAALASIDDVATRATLDAERAFLAELGGDCSIPAGAYAKTSGADVHLDAIVASPDGSQVVRAADVAPATDVERLGRALARHLLDDLGGSALLARS